MTKKDCEVLWNHDGRETFTSIHWSKHTNAAEHLHEWVGI